MKRREPRKAMKEEEEEACSRTLSANKAY